MFIFLSYGDHRDLHSFPTRRSSDLLREESVRRQKRSELAHLVPEDRQIPVVDVEAVVLDVREHGARKRSEEHTSELQSHVNLVCRLLLEKKKKIVVVELKGQLNKEH